MKSAPTSIPQIDMTKVMESVNSDLRDQLVSKVKENLIQTLSWEVENAIKDQTGEWIKENIIPEVTSILAEQKPVILQGIAASVGEVGNEICKALVREAAKNLEQSWNVAKIAEGLFK